MINLNLERLYRYDRLAEILEVSIPVKKGRLFNLDEVRVFDGEKALPVQTEIICKHEEGSVKFFKVYIMSNLPGNKAKTLELALDEEDLATSKSAEKEKDNSGYQETDGSLHNITINPIFTDFIISSLPAPQLTIGEATTRDASESETKIPSDAISGKNETFNIVKDGSLVRSYAAKGSFPGTALNYTQTVTFQAGKPWCDVSFYIENDSTESIGIKSLSYHFGKALIAELSSDKANLPIFDKVVSDAAPAEGDDELPVKSLRTATGYSYYRTKFDIRKDDSKNTVSVMGSRLLNEGSEHFPEVLYGTFFGDYTDANGGLTATVFQAQQNFPKAVSVDGDGLAIWIVPDCSDAIILKGGCGRTQKFQLIFHDSDLSVNEINNRSLIYQMPDHIVLDPEVYIKSETYPDYSLKNNDVNFELALLTMADSHGHCFGMLNWGDFYDKNYTRQGRGQGKMIYINNEYDYVHACALQYMRTGERRFFDYMRTTATHVMDMDVCHFSDNPLYVGGQIEHTAGHVENANVAPSHQWVEGYLDYYHLTGDERGLKTAIGIGENIQRLLATPKFSTPGEANARETGWALRALTALYNETGDEKWLEKCEWIVQQFFDWEEKYGAWVAAYTDNTMVYVGFMISVALGSLMRYYKVRPSDSLRDMMVRQIDNLVDECMVGSQVFFYKSLPSLRRTAGNPLLLEAMQIGYELTGNKRYLQAGIKTFCNIVDTRAVWTKPKNIMEDAVVFDGESMKTFAQRYIPLVAYRKALEQAGIDPWK